MEVLYRRSSHVQRSKSMNDCHEPAKNLKTIPQKCSESGLTLLIVTNVLRFLKNMDDKLKKLSDDVKEIKKTLENKRTVSKNKKTRFYPRKVNMTIASKGQQKRSKLGYSSRKLCSADCKHLKEQIANQYLQMIMMMTLGIEEKSLTDQKLEETPKRKSELNMMRMVHTKEDSIIRDDLDRTLAKAGITGEQREPLLDSFMYKDYHNGFSAVAKNLELFPLISSSRNIDEYVAKELHSSLSTRQSEGASGSRSHDSRSSESLHSMNLELIRLETFKNFPASRIISSIKLAKEGFYYSGHDDQVTCFSCGFEKSGWRVNDDPREIHRQQSPNCPFIQAQSVNVPVGEGSNSQDPENVVQIAQQNASNLNSTENGAQSQGTEEATSDENLPSTPERDHIALPPVRNVETTSVQRDPVSEPQNTEETRCEENFTNQQQVHSSAINYSARKTQEKINAFLRNLDPLGINFDRPKYPAYAVLATRVSSYQGWPASLTQQPRDLGTAGFFYVGYGDYTRCFFCGGGLRNWEPGDDPWTEHARWFPKCAFVRQNKGDEFVALVQIKHQELVSIWIYVNILLFYFNFKG